MSDLISRQAAIDKLKYRLIETALNSVGIRQNVDETLIDVADERIERWLDEVPSIQSVRDIPKRVLWSGWKGVRDTRYRCPNCKKPVRNTDVYCHRCGQKLMFPHISFTDYVPGEKQQTIVRWDDDNNGIDRNPSTE